MTQQKGYIVILAGGGGTRLWPVSRSKLPKQFLKLTNNKTLFQDTFFRIKDKFIPSHIYVVTSRIFVKEVKKEVPQILSDNIITEPSGKNTAAAASLAASIIYKKDPQAVISTLAADHYIKEKPKFIKVLFESQKAARKGNYIVTVGIRPTEAHTGLGYIHIDGEELKIEQTPFFRVERFKEKPDLVTTYAYVASGQFFWNANINSYRASTLLEAIKKYLPHLSEVLNKFEERQDNYRGFEKIWNSLSSEPIDTAILEKAKNVLMIPGNFSWFDVGDWAAVYNLTSPGKRKNVQVGKPLDYLHLNTEGCLIYSKNKKLIATFGIKDMLVIDTGDVLLVGTKENSQEVKKLVEKLHKNKKDRYL